MNERERERGNKTPSRYFYWMSFLSFSMAGNSNAIQHKRHSLQSAGACAINKNKTKAPKKGSTIQCSTFKTKGNLNNDLSANQRFKNFWILNGPIFYGIQKPDQKINFFEAFSSGFWLPFKTELKIVKKYIFCYSLNNKW